MKFSAIGQNPLPYAQLQVTDSAYGSSQTVSLKANVLEPIAAVNPVKLTFAAQKSGTTSSPSPITLQNTGSGPLSLTALTTTGNFALAGGSTCTKTTTLQPKATCLLEVDFAPTSTGVKTGAMTITDISTTPTLVIPLSGTGN